MMDDDDGGGGEMGRRALGCEGRTGPNRGVVEGYVVDSLGGRNKDAWVGLFVVVVVVDDEGGGGEIGLGRFAEEEEEARGGGERGRAAEDVEGGGYCFTVVSIGLEPFVDGGWREG